MWKVTGSSSFVGHEFDFKKEKTKIRKESAERNYYVTTNLILYEMTTEKQSSERRIKGDCAFDDTMDCSEWQ